MSEGGHPKIVIQPKESRVSSQLDITTEIGLCIEQVDLNCIFSKSETRIKSSIRSICLQLTPLSDRHSPNSSNEATVFDCRIVGLDVDSQPDVVRLRWVDFATTVGPRGPELLTAAAIALEQELSDGFKTLSAIDKHEKAVLQKLTYETLRLSENLTVIDPLSTIQPSYLVQAGTPHMLRTDPTFRFLFHLRNCLRSLPPDDRNHISTSCQVDPVSPGDFESMLQSRVVNLDLDLDSTHDSTLLDQLLKIRRSKNLRTAAVSNSIPAVSIELIKTRLHILAPTGLSDNEFCVVGLRLHMRMQSLDLIQHTFSNPASMSQTSLRDKRPHLVKRISVQVTIDDIHFMIYSHLMNFVQQILRVRRIYLSQMALAPPKAKPLDKQPSSEKGGASIYVDTAVVLHSVRLRAAAANLTFEVGSKALQSVSSLSLPSGQDEESLSTSLLFDKIYLQAHSPLDKAKEGTDQDVLAAFDFTKGRVSGVMRREQNLRRNTKVLFSLGGLHLRVPRSALKLYHFVEEWRADFLPGMEATFRAALSELRIPSEKKTPAPSVRSSINQPLLQLSGQVTEMGISLQIMHGTWLSWKVNNIVAYTQSSPTPFGALNLAFGLQIASTILEISTKDSPQDRVSNSRVKLAFPSLSLGGNYDGRLAHTLVIIDYLDIKVKPSHWDTLLVVQQKFGQDFNDFVALMQETRLKSSSKSRQPEQRKPQLNFNGFLKMRGFRIGFEGFSSTMFLECQDIGGGLRSGGNWDVGLTDLALSLAPRLAGSTVESFDRGHRSVFVNIDAKVLGGKEKKFPNNQTLELVITKTHAVMQPTSIGEIGDFIDHLQVRGAMSCIISTYFLTLDN